MALFRQLWFVLHPWSILQNSKYDTIVNWDGQKLRPKIVILGDQKLLSTTVILDSLKEGLVGLSFDCPKLGLRANILDHLKLLFNGPQLRPTAVILDCPVFWLLVVILDPSNYYCWP